MGRSVLLVLPGAIAGGVAVGLLALPAGEVPEQLMTVESIANVDSSVLDSAVPDPEALDNASALSQPTLLTDAAVATSSSVAGGGMASARVAAYRRALEAADAFDLETMIDIAAASPRSRIRDLEIEALLARLSELDPLRAAVYARSAFLETRFLIQAFEALLRFDRDAAIAELSSVTPAARQRKLAIALLGIVGNDEDGIELLASVLPDDDRLSFELDALVARAQSDPLGALREALELDNQLLQLAVLPRLAEIAAVNNSASAALMLASSIEDNALRQTLASALMQAWAGQDPQAVFRWLENADFETLQAGRAAFQALARSDADRLLGIIEDLPPALRSSARSAYMQALVERDVTAAIAELDTMVVGQERDQMVQTIAQAYAQQDPEAALAWVRSLSPPSQTAMQAVLRGVAFVDVDRAIDLFIEELDRPGADPFGGPTSLTVSLSFSMMVSTLSASGADVARLTDRLLESNDTRTRSILASVLSSWSSRDMDAALAWTLENAAALDSTSLRNLSRRMAETDPDRALAVLDQLAPSERAGWIDGIVRQLAQSDLDRAMQLVDSYRGQPGYETANAGLVQELARIDPERAARRLSESGFSNETMSASFMVAREWANQDPRAAARWAISEVGNEQTQRATLNLIATTWAQRDAGEVERWLVGLNSGPARDAAADGLVQAMARNGEFEPRYFEAYSSDEASQRGTMNAIVTISTTDPDRAVELMDTWLTDPALRRQAEESIARNAAARSGSLVGPGLVIFQ